MAELSTLVTDILSLPPAARTPEQVIIAKRKYAKEGKLAELPTNVHILKTYKQLVEQGTVEQQSRIEQLLKKRAIRSMSGIVPIQVLTKPFRCPGKCIFCPNDATMPKSYINTQPGAMRALLNNFDPYRQAYNRLLSLNLTGHATDKIEMIVLGGTRDVYPRKYKTRFVKGLYDACNHFEDFLEQIDIDFTNARLPKYTLTDGLNIDYPETIEESITRNETSAHRIIGLTIETRPEYVTDKNCQYRRTIGVTRVEMGIQSLDDTVLDMNKRGHGTDEIETAMHKLRQYGFKISTHFMPGLYGSDIEKDIETFRIAYSAPSIKPDEIKFYPTAVIPNTELYDLWKAGKYHALDEQELRTITKTIKEQLIPPYTRIKRLARDFATNEVAAGANTPNLRQLVMHEMEHELTDDADKREELYGRLRSISDRQLTKDNKKVGGGTQFFSSGDELIDYLHTPSSSMTQTYTSTDGKDRQIDGNIETLIVGGEIDTTSERNFVCLCTRCREVRHKAAENDLFVVVRRYRSSNGEELFISYEDKLGYLAGFTRLCLPGAGKTVAREGLGEGTAIMRELHVYGEMVSLTNPPQPPLSGGESSKGEKSQHKGLGKKLIMLAEQISAVRDYERLSIISGVGVRGYYQKLGYELVGTYMVKGI